MFLQIGHTLPGHIWELYGACGKKFNVPVKYSVIERMAGAPAVAANVYRDGDGLLRELDMGSPFDHFGPVSWPDSREVTPQQRANRALLQSLMTAQGFLPYAQEWWHFTLSGEPYPDTYFDFLSRRP